MKFVEEKGWEILNGNIRGDKEGEYTYIGALGSTVIDYALGDKEVKDTVREMKIGDKVDSDHRPVEVIIRGKDKWRGVRSKECRVWRRVWDEEGCEKFRRRLGEVEEVGTELEEEWKGMESRLKKTLKEVEEERDSKRGGRRGWWDKECWTKKKEVRKELREWRKKGGEGLRYKERKRDYRGLM